jgi:SAM-dependent methyltransferase
MQNASHQAIDQPSAWVLRWAAHIPAGGRVLDVACGGGRHARYLAGLGFQVEAVDRNGESLRSLAGVAGVTTRAADLENGEWPYAGRQFEAVVVTNYLHRPLFPALLAALAPGGVMIYETFALGNERYGRPSNPDFLLKPGELLKIAHGRVEVIAYENLVVDFPKPAMIQRVCAVNGAINGAGKRAM